MPDTRLVSGTVRIFLDNEEQPELPEWSPDDPYVSRPINPPIDLPPAEPEEYIDLLSGRITIAAPDTGSVLKVSYYFQWFTDEELSDFLTQSAQLLGYESIEDGSMPVSHRAPLLSFAAHYAYLKMAANSAQALTAAAGGFTADNTSEHPNWRSLAELAWETGKAEMELIADNPLTGTVNKPSMAFVTFHLQRYVPWT